MRLHSCNSAKLLSLAMVWLLASFPALAGNLVDDFTEISGSVSYPIMHDVTMPAALKVDAPLSSTIAPARSIFFTAGRPIPPNMDPAEDVNLTIHVDPNEGKLISTASAASTNFVILGWTNEFDMPTNADLTHDTHLAIDYTSPVELNLLFALSNVDTNGDTQGANRATTTMPAGTNLRFLLPLTDVNEDIIDISTFPDNFPFPPIDLSSVDGITMQLTTAELGVEFCISQVAFLLVPEPASGVLLLAGTALYGLRRRRWST